MKITCWGARGSIPVSGQEYVKYGGDTTCIEIRSKDDDDVIIIDAGTGMRRLGNKLLASDRRSYNVLFTHAHWDHLMGLPFFKPLYEEGRKIRMFGCAYVQRSVRKVLSQCMIAPYFPVDFDDVPAEISTQEVCDKTFEIGPVRITPMQLSHPNRGIGYKFVEDGKSFVFLTDNELGLCHPGGEEYRDYLRFSEGADLLIHDAEFTEEQYRLTKGWGHSLYTDALRLALDAKAGQFGLFHHNQDRTDAGLDRVVEDCRRIVKAENSPLLCYAMEAGMEIVL